MASIGLLKTLPPWNVLAFGALFGMQIHQSFITGIQAHRQLSRENFVKLQSSIFPIYFTAQAALPIVLAVTYPGEAGPLGVSTASSIAGVLDSRNLYSVLLPLVSVFVGAILNIFVISPRIYSLIKARQDQEVKDGKKYYDPGPHSPEMQRLNKVFGKAHGMSALSNLLSLLGTALYGLTIASKLH